MRYLLLLLTLSLFVACSDPNSGKDTTKVELQGAFVLNEGQFTQANGSLSFYSPEADSVQNNIFENVNGRALGDIVNDMLIVDSIAFIVVNNSNTIEVMSLNTWKSKGTIPAGDYTAPYNIALAAPGKIYVSNLYANSVSVISVENLAIEKTIAVGANPEGIAVAGDYAFVANSGFGYANTVTVIDTKSDEVKATIRVGDNPQTAVVDADGRVQVLCSGSYGDYYNPNDDTPGGLYVIDPTTLSVTDSMIIGGHPGRLVMDDNGYAYYKNGAIVQYNQKSLQVTDSTFIDGGFFYNFAYDEVSEQFFVTDAKDFTQNGEVIIFDKDGKEVKRYVAGIIPGKIVFYYQ